MGGGGNSLAVVGGYPGFFVMPFYAGFGPGGAVGYPGLVMGPSAFGFGPFGPMQAPPMWQRGPLLPPPPPDLAARVPRQPEKAARAPSDPKRASQLMTIGDRLFRAGNLKKAEERYQQAVRASADLAAPYVRLAQLAIVRGNYTVAANRLREAETAQPGWLETAPDIQSIYGEPGDFARQLARIESHVQIHPDDRDAWLVLARNGSSQGGPAAPRTCSCDSTTPIARRTSPWPPSSMPATRSSLRPRTRRIRSSDFPTTCCWNRMTNCPQSRPGEFRVTRRPECRLSRPHFPRNGHG